MLGEWYLWEKSPGTVGVLPAAQLKKHADAFILTVSGSLEDAIRQAEICEKEGYSVMPSCASEPGEKNNISELPVDSCDDGAECAESTAGADEFSLPDFMSFEDYSPVAPKSRLAKKKKNSVADDGLEGQLSLDLGL